MRSPKFRLRFKFSKTEENIFNMQIFSIFRFMSFIFDTFCDEIISLLIINGLSLLLFLWRQNLPTNVLWKCGCGERTLTEEGARHWLTAKLGGKWNDTGRVRGQKKNEKKQKWDLNRDDVKENFLAIGKKIKGKIKKRRNPKKVYGMSFPPQFGIYSSCLWASIALTWSLLWTR